MVAFKGLTTTRSRGSARVLCIVICCTILAACSAGSAPDVEDNSSSYPQSTSTETTPIPYPQSTSTETTPIPYPQSTSTETTAVPYSQNSAVQVVGNVTKVAGSAYSSAVGGLVSVGDTGPAGGVVFYVDSMDVYPGFVFLEAAPAQYSQTLLPFTPATYRKDVLSSVTSTDMGAGLANTINIAREVGDGNYASKYSLDMSVNGFSDWFLPSLREMEALCMYSAGVNNDPESSDFGLCARSRSLLYGQEDQYWTSSNANSVYTWLVVLGKGHTLADNTRLSEVRVVPVRYFN